MRILITDDDSQLASALAMTLQDNGYATEIAPDGESALRMASINSYDLIILDINLPGIDGIEVCRRLRAAGSETGILMLTTRSEMTNRVQGLDQGADDYVTKPFHLGELLSRVRAIIRRGNVIRQTMLRADKLVLDPNTMKAFYNGIDVGLTLKEFSLLEYLLRNQDRIVDQQELLDHVWGDDIDVLSQTVKVHISRAREKLNTLGGHNLINTIKGKGYFIGNTQAST